VILPLPRYFAVDMSVSRPVDEIIGGLNAQGFWMAPLEMNSHPYRGDGSKQMAPGDFSETYVGDESDTSPYPDTTISGISTAAYIRNMSVLIRALGAGRDGSVVRGSKVRVLSSPHGQGLVSHRLGPTWIPESTWSPPELLFRRMLVA
jgi:hypothetical protein